MMAKNIRCITVLILVTLAFGITSLIKGIASEELQVLVNETASIRCFPNHDISVQWHHTPPGKSSSAYVYAGGRFYGSYEDGRFSLDAHNYTLVITNVTHEDAGLYECKDDILRGVFGSTQLIALNSGPACNSNMHPAGFIGPNECDLQKEDMTFSCGVSFAGNAPSLTWRSLTGSHSFVNSVCTTQSNHINCSLTLKADPDYDGTVFVCETKASNGGVRFNCSTEVVKVQYFSVDNETSARKVHENVTCIVRSSNLETRYYWKIRVEKNDQYVFLSSNRTIALQKPGIYRCYVEYSIRHNTCSFLTSVVNASVVTNSGGSQKEQGNVLAVVLSIVFSMVLLGVAVNVASVIYAKRTKEGRKVTFGSRLSDIPKTKVRSEKAISGLAIVDLELFVTYFKSREIGIYDLTSLAFIRSITIDELINAYDMKHCAVNRCLYIMDANYSNTSKSIIKVTSFGEEASWISWRTRSGHGCISVTSDHSILLAVLQEGRIEEYGPNGALILEIKLSPDTAISYLRYAIRLSDDRFLISQDGEADDQLHRVCVIDAAGNIEVTSGDRRGYGPNRFNVPIYLTIDSRGSIVVIDRDNSRVLSLEPNSLDFGREVIQSKRDGMIRPERMVLDEARGKIVIAHNDVGWERCCFFVFDYN